MRGDGQGRAAPNLGRGDTRAEQASVHEPTGLVPAVERATVEKGHWLPMGADR